MGRAYQNRKVSKAKTSDMKARVYSKYSREVYVCAKNGSVDPGSNPALRAMIDRAKKEQVPSHVIDKAIAKASSGEGEDFELAIYEGYGPGKCMVMVVCLTDNPNRTFGDVRMCFTKTKCKIGTQGSVSHMFDHSIILAFAHDDEDAILEILLNADVDVTDVESEDGVITVFAPHTEYFNAKQALEAALGEIDYNTDEIQYLPQNTSPVEGEDLDTFHRFYDLLDDLDDVQNIYHSAEF